MKYSETSIYKLACEAQRLARKAVPAYSSKFPIKELPGDKGYDDRYVRDTLRSMGICPLIKQRIQTKRQGSQC